MSQSLIEFCLWNSEGVSLSAVNPFTIFPLAPLVLCCSSTLWFLGWQPPCHRTSLGSIMPHSTTHQTSLSLSALLILLNYKSSILSCKITISVPQKPGISESVSLTTSPAASLVSLHLDYVKPRALILWAGFTHCWKEPPWAAKQMWCLFLCNPSGGSNLGLDRLIISHPLSYYPAPHKLVLCSQLQFVLGEGCPLRRCLHENFKIHLARK